MKGRYDDVEVTNNYNPPPSKVVRAVGLVVKVSFREGGF